MKVHHNDCTWCLERYGIVVTEGKKKREKELCQKGHVVGAPFSGNPRYCQEYRQRGCTECESGQVAIEHMSYNLRIVTECDKLRPFEETAT